MLRCPGILSLNVRTLNGSQMKKTELEARATAYEFKFMYCYGSAIRRRKSKKDFFFRERWTRGGAGERVFDNVPRKRFDEGAVDYFRLALSTRDAYVQYVSFYHVLEFYFYKSFKRGVADRLRIEITKASFDLTDEKLYKVACEMCRVVGSREENGYGGERQELKYVLIEHVPNLEELKEGIRYHDQNAVERYQKNGVSFAREASKINWANAQEAYDQIASRVYQTRNALMHSKDREGSNRYRPFKDEKALRSEVPLVHALAEVVIDNAAKR